MMAKRNPPKSRPPPAAPIEIEWGGDEPPTTRTITNPFERETLVPPIPQAEFVARLMASVPPSDPPLPTGVDAGDDNSSDIGGDEWNPPTKGRFASSGIPGERAFLRPPESSPTTGTGRLPIGAPRAGAIQTLAGMPKPSPLSPTHAHDATCDIATIPATPNLRPPLPTIRDIDPLQYDHAATIEPPATVRNLHASSDARALEPRNVRAPLEAVPPTADAEGPLTLDLSELPPPSSVRRPSRGGPPESGSSGLESPGSHDAEGSPIQSFAPQAARDADARRRPLVAIREHVDVGDFSGALVLAEELLVSEPACEEARRHADECRLVLKQMYVARLGGISRIPKRLVSTEQLRWLALDHRAGFLLASVDGVMSVEEILDVSGMSQLDALRILFDLQQQSIILVL